MELGIELYVVRVPTKENLSDDPSRERYGLIEHLGVSALVPDRQPGLFACADDLLQAEFREACLDPRFHDAASWESLGVTTHRAWRTHASAVNSVALPTPSVPTETASAVEQ